MIKNKIYQLPRLYESDKQSDLVYKTNDAVSILNRRISALEVRRDIPVTSTRLRHEQESSLYSYDISGLKRKQIVYGSSSGGIGQTSDLVWDYANNANVFAIGSSSLYDWSTTYDDAVIQMGDNAAFISDSMYLSMAVNAYHDTTQDDWLYQSSGYAVRADLEGGENSSFTVYIALVSDANHILAWQNMFAIGASEICLNDHGADCDMRIESDSYTHAFFLNGDTGYIGLNESSPGTQLDMAGTAPYITIHNTTEEDGDGGREGKLIFEGEKEDGTLHTLGELEFSHNGTGDDTYGQFTLRVHNGTSLTEFVTINNSGYVGIGYPDPTNLLEVSSSTANPVLSINARHNTDYDPTLQFKTDGAPTVKAKLFVDGTDDVVYFDYDVANATGKSFVIQANAVTKLTIADADITMADGIGLNLQEDITFTGATTENQIAIPTNLADALSIHDGVGDLIVFDTTTGSQVITITPSVGIGAAPSNEKLRVYDDAVNTTDSYYGIYNYHIKSAGTTDKSDTISGLYSYMEYDQVSGVIGNLTGIYSDVIHNNGDIGDDTAFGTRFLHGILNNLDLDVGKVWGSGYGQRIAISQAGTHEFTGDVFGSYINLSVGGTVGGNVYGIYINEDTGVNYGIYQNGTGANVLGGTLSVGAITSTGNLDIGANTFTVNSIEIVGADGEVNKAAVEDSGNWDTAYTHSQDNSQAHSDYLINNGDDSTSGALTVGSLITGSDIGIAADTDLIQLTGANLMKVNGNLGVAGGNPLAQAGMNITFAYTGIANCYGFYESFTWTPTANGGSIYGANMIAGIAGTKNIMYGYSFYNRFNIEGSGQISNNLYCYRGEIKPNNTTRTIVGNLYLNYSTTTLVGAKVTVTGLGAQAWLDDYNDAFNVGGVNYGLVQIGSSLINHFEGEIRLDTDSVPVSIGEGQDLELMYDGSHAYFRMHAGSGQFIFDTFTDIDQDCQLLLKAGESKDVMIWLYMDEGDENADKWRILADNTDNSVSFETYASGAFVKPVQFLTDGGVLMSNLKTGATQVAAGAAAGELWVTNSHASLPDNVVVRGV